jgi:hypothetical protein
MSRVAIALAASLLFTNSAYCQAPPNQPSDALAGLEQLLYGTWKGPACGGDWNYKADGTFETVHFTPAGSRLTGTWKLKWDSLPPILVRTCKTSDDSELVGKTWEAKLIELTKDSHIYQHADQYPKGHKEIFTRENEHQKVPPE